MKRVLLGTVVGLAGLAAPLESALAQSTSEDIVVTAQRRAQSAQDVPISLSVVDGAALAEKNVSTVNDLENVVPNLEVDSQFGGGQPQFRIRGIGAREYSSNNASTVGVYIDEVAHPYTVTTQGALFDVSRIEVLRGPQGTLYGRNTTGGAVNIITNAPTEDFTIGATAEYGSYDRYRIEGHAGGALSDNVRARIAAYTEQGGAWQYNRVTRQELGDADRFGVRGRVAIDFSEAATLDLSATWTRDQSDGLGFRLLAPYAAVGGPTYPADTQWRITGWQISPDLAPIAGVGLNAKPFRDNEGVDVSATLRVDLGGVELTSLTSYQTFDRSEYNDWDSTPYAESDVYFFNNIEVLSQEVRLSSTDDGPLEWLVGAHYANESNDGGFYTEFRGRADVILTPYQQEVEAIGVFGNASLALTEQLSLIGGLRYEDEQRSLRTPGTIVGFFPSLGIYPTYGAGPRYETSLSEVSGRLGLEYDATDDVLLYATVSRGVKSGGFTTYNANSALPFRPEIVWAYEAGLRSELLDRRIRFNAATFYYDYADQQVQGIEYDPIVGRLGKITNVPESTIYGAEFEFEWRVTDGLTISQYASFKEGEYDEYFAVDDAATAAANPVNGPWTVIIASDRAGERLGMPRWNYGGAISYDWSLGGLDWRAETNYSHRSDLYSVTSSSVIEGYWLTNASVGFGAPDGGWRFTVWGRNIFDEYYEETRNGFNGSARRTTSPHQGQTVGVRLALSN